jgi:hypothetical protein
MHVVLITVRVNYFVVFAGIEKHPLMFLAKPKVDISLSKTCLKSVKFLFA